MIIVDTSGLLSAIDGSQKYHRECAAVLSNSSPPFLLSPFVLAELDYLLIRHVGPPAQSLLLEEVARGTYQLEPFAPTDIARAKQITDRYKDLEIGLADASIVVLAERHDVAEVLTLALRHFRTIRFDKRKRFRIFPADG